jgi:hypothetical protein
MLGLLFHWILHIDIIISYLNVQLKYVHFRVIVISINWKECYHIEIKGTEQIEIIFIEIY